MYPFIYIFGVYLFRQKFESIYHNMFVQFMQKVRSTDQKFRKTSNVDTHTHHTFISEQKCIIFGYHNTYDTRITLFNGSKNRKLQTYRTCAPLGHTLIEYISAYRLPLLMSSLESPHSASTHIHSTVRRWCLSNKIKVKDRETGFTWRRR